MVKGPQPAPSTAPASPPLPPPTARVADDPRLASIDQVARREISSGHIPGAVVLVGHGNEIVYRKPFGNRSVDPRPEPMSEDTIFDIASLTKVVATAPAIMLLADRDRLRIDDPAAEYWPDFAANGKGNITIRQLLTHTSGLRADVNPRVPWSGYEEALSVVAADRPLESAGAGFRYSDANFIVLGEIIRRVSGQPLDVFCEQEIFGPLGMYDTSFRPSISRRPRIAPSDAQNGVIRRGEVQDPTAYRMGGVAGHAGVFSTANDLAVFVQMLLAGGVSRGRRILSPGALAAMTKPQSVPGDTTVRGLGWDMRSPYSKEHSESFPERSYGHTGYTGSSVWIDPRSRTFLIILTNRLHPSGKGQVKPMRAGTAAAVADVLMMGRRTEVLNSDRTHDSARSEKHGEAGEAGPIRLGIDVLASSGFAPLAGRNVGLITNHTAIDGAGRSTANVLLHAPGVRLRAIFTPEHGLAGNLDEKIPSGKDPSTGLPVHSLYGDVKRPTPEMLRGLDTLVYDIQDVGARFYTYVTTMAYAMEAGAASGLDFFVLDRPNPITASIVQGPVLDPDLKSFVGYYPMPVRYGMTAGELARLFNGENGIGARLHVVPMEGYRREAWFDDTGLPWVNPSPNIRSLTQAALYPGVALVESANVSVGRGTDSPFEVVGAPWISGERLAGYLNGRKVPGVRFEPASFTPADSRFRSQRCEGVRLILDDREALDGPALGIELAAALYRLHPGELDIDRTLGMIGSRDVLQAVKNGDDPRDICRGWTAKLDDFRRVRQKYLFY
jgi:uncharacterized protein YbbC (DUF1343 family)